MICTECGLTPIPDGEAWDFGDIVYCQMCWESHCDDAWWDEIDKIRTVLDIQTAEEWDELWSVDA